MTDREIVALYWERDSAAIRETASKYGAYCKAIAKNILGNDEDAAECVNDAYLNAWNSIQLSRPQHLSAYLGKITRNLSFDRFRQRRAEKRGGGEMELVLEELAECVSGADSPGRTVENRELVLTINRFLNTLPQRKCSIFLCRYWYAFPVSEIAARFGMTEGNVSVTLAHIRRKLKTYLTERGFDL